LFGEKYSDVVRVIGMGEFSTELCGGTHVSQSGQIGFFKIIAESGVAAGIRRVEAVTGIAAVDYVQQREAQLLEIAQTLKANPQEVTQKIAQIIDNVRQTEKELNRLKTKLASSQGKDLAEQAQEVQGVKVLAANVDNADAKTLRDTLDQLKDKLKTCAIVLSSVDNGKITLIAGVSADLTRQMKAGELVNFVAQQVGGKGGGRPDMAQAGGTEPEHLPAALATRPASIVRIRCSAKETCRSTPRSSAAARNNWKSGFNPAGATLLWEEPLARVARRRHLRLAQPARQAVQGMNYRAV